MEQRDGSKAIVFIISILFIFSACKQSPENDRSGLLMIKEQGSFAVGGTVIQNEGTFNPIIRTPEGQTYHGDHAYITYQIPDNAHKLPLVFWHGI